MIDLHMHTTYSDGTDNLVEILKKAEESKLEIISITDHDSVDAYLEMKKMNTKDYFSGKIINGIEVRSIYKKIPIEILGYGIDINIINNSKYIKQKTIEEKEKELEHLKKIGKSIGLKFYEDLKVSSKKASASGTFSHEIYKRQENRKIIQDMDLGEIRELFYRKTVCNPKSIFYVDESINVQSPDRIIEEIHKAGGLAFLAHTFIYPFADHIEVIEEVIKEFKIDGFECYYPLFTKEQTNQILEMCKKNNLYVSGGSDYHGKNKPKIELGTGMNNLKIEKEAISDWIVKLS